MLFLDVTSDGSVTLPSPIASFANLSQEYALFEPGRSPVFLID